MTHQEQREELGMDALAELYGARCCRNCAHFRAELIYPWCARWASAAMESGGEDCELFERRDR